MHVLTASGSAIVEKVKVPNDTSMSRVAQTRATAEGKRKVA
jgi:hypothetical protein